MLGKARTIYSEACQLKDIAISQNNADLYEPPLEKLKQAYEILEKVIDEFKTVDIEGRILLTSYTDYYKYEFYNCLAANLLKKGCFLESKAVSERAQYHINCAIRIVTENYSELNNETQKKIDQLKLEWMLFQVMNEVHIFEPNAKKAMREKNYIVALDNFTLIDSILDKAKSYLEDPNLRQEIKRIQLGNYFAFKGNICIARCGIYTERLKEIDYRLELLGEFLKIIDYGDKALEANPQWIEYKTGKDVHVNNIVKLLYENKNYWFTFYDHYKDNKNLTSIMKKIDIQKYNEIEFSRELAKEKNKTKLLFIRGFFFTMLLVVIVTLLIVVFDRFNYLIGSTIIGGTVIIYLLSAGFTLKSIGELSQENLIKLIQLAVRLNLGLLKRKNINS